MGYMNTLFCAYPLSVGWLTYTYFAITKAFNCPVRGLHQLYDAGAQLVSPKDQCMRLKSVLYVLTVHCLNLLQCIVCVLQDSQVDQHFADGTFPAKKKHIARHGLTELAGVFLGS